MKSKSFSDLRPGRTIKCFSCGDTKPDAGSQKFRAHTVCADCVLRLQSKDRKAGAA